MAVLFLSSFKITGKIKGGVVELSLLTHFSILIHHKTTTIKILYDGKNRFSFHTSPLSDLLFQVAKCFKLDKTNKNEVENDSAETGKACRGDCVSECHTYLEAGGYVRRGVHDLPVV